MVVASAICWPLPPYISYIALRLLISRIIKQVAFFAIVDNEWVFSHGSILEARTDFVELVVFKFQLFEVGDIWHKLVGRRFVSNKLDAGEFKAKHWAEVSCKFCEPLLLRFIVLFFLCEVLVKFMDEGYKMFTNFTHVLLWFKQLIHRVTKSLSQSWIQERSRNTLSTWAFLLPSR